MTEQIIKFSDLCHFTPKQKEASEAVKDNKYILYGGAMGGGKSYWLRWSLIKLLLQFAKDGHRNVTVGLFCEDYPSLKDRHLSKVRFEFPDWLGTLSVTDHNFVLHPDYGGGVLAFRNLDDASKYQSSEFAAIGVDEITKNARNIFDFLRTRLRWPGIKDTKFLAATNPGGIGHEWVKKLWIDRIFDPNEKEQDDFAYIQAKAIDNPHLDPSYLVSLEGLPEDMRRAFLEGDWDIFAGQYFKEFRKEIHVIPPHEILPHYKKIICGDYGYAKPSAVYWCYTDSDGFFYPYRELYSTDLTYENLTREIIAMTPPNEQIDYWVFDPAIWAKKGETELSGAEIIQRTYQEITKKTFVLIRGNNDRLNGWNVLREYLKPTMRGGKPTAKLQIFSGCQNLVRTLPSLIYDKIRVEDLDSDGEDHAADAIRYGLMSRPQSTPKPNVWNALDKQDSRPRLSFE